MQFGTAVAMAGITMNIQKPRRYLPGFSSPSNFTRAFKAWSGRTVSDFLRAEGG